MAYGDGRLIWRGPLPEGGPKGSWHIAFFANGREHRLSAKTRNKTEARKRLRAEVNKARGPGWVEPSARGVLIGELVRDLIAFYNSSDRAAFAKNTERRWILHLEKPFGKLPAVAMTTAHQRAYRASRGAANATINRELQIIRKAFKLAAENDPPKVSRVPKFEIYREDNARLNFFTDDEVSRLLEVSAARGAWQGAFVAMAYVLGWRWSELLSLRIGDVNLPERTVRIRTSKNKEPRECPITDEIVSALRAAIGNRDPQDLVFPGNNESKKEWFAIRKAAGIEGVFHDWRRTAARAKRARGVDTTVIMQMQGWRSFGMFRRYAIVSVEDQRSAIDKLGQQTVRKPIDSA